MKFFKVIFLFLLNTIVLAQELPPISNYESKDYGAENQNWAISQAEDKFIYVANNKGLLEFNGADWQLYPSPNETIFRSVKAFQNKIFTGFYMDFGYWKKNNLGKLEYTSIVQRKNIQMLEDEQIWNILEIDGWIIFKSLERIYLYNLSTEEIRTIKAENRITRIAKVNGIIYFQEINKGIFKIENGTPKLVSDHPILKDNIIAQIFYKNNTLLLLTQVKGFYLLDNNSLLKWNSDLDTLFSNTKIYSAKQLNNGNFVLGSVSKGVINLNSEGELNYQINQETGLNNNTVLSVFEDVEQNIWLGLDNGISCINNTSPFKFYNKKTDFLGTVYTSIIFKGNLYLGTNQGLFYKNLNANSSFKFVSNTQGQVWSLAIIDETLFCGHDSGTFIIDAYNAKKVFKGEGTWDIRKYDENHIIQGSYDGLHVLEKTNRTWKFKNKIEGFNNSSRYFLIKDASTIFVNHEYKGVYKVKINSSLTQSIKVEVEKSVKKGLYSSLIKYKSDILFSSKQGVFKYNNQSDTFIRDSVYSQLIDKNNFTSGKLIYNKRSDQLWSFSKNNIKYFSPGKLSNIPILHKIPILERHRKSASGYENIIEISNSINLIGTSKGYLTLDLNQFKEPENFTIYLDEISVFKRNSPKRNINITSAATLINEENNMEISFSVPNYSKTLATNYQYKLEGFDEDWSSFTTSNSILFENIPFGDYEFKVRAIVGEKISDNVAHFSFKIQKPWYLSNYMILLYGLIISLIIYIYHISSKKYYKRQKDILIERARKESELKELENSQKIIKLNNDKLRSDIESKNKELASSTMNLIKKNEFLSTIRKELVKGDEKSIKNVIKIIDKDLNNTDDWKMFQEAFNNADKKFIKKLKSKHSKLTPNDLRLCAYLRLNLSSKEIAPLLNISTRSVEVKRYRLRKKLDLDHDANLTNYILEI